MSEHESLRERLCRKLKEARIDDWGGRAPLEFEIVEGTDQLKPDGALSVGLLVYAVGRNGNRVIVHEAPLQTLQSEDDLDNWLADALSKTLMKHTTWPA